MSWAGKGRSWERRLAPGWILGLLLCTALAWPGTADYKDSYQAGMEAFRQGRWQQVVRHMRDAIADREKAGGSVRIPGSGRQPYVPYYWLGRALVELGNCEGALRAFNESRAQGKLGRGLALERDRLARDCRQRLSQAPRTRVEETVPDAVVKPPPQEPGEDREALERLEEIRREAARREAARREAARREEARREAERIEAERIEEERKRREAERNPPPQPEEEKEEPPPPPPSPPTPPSDLRQAAEAFVAGKYQDTLQKLNRLDSWGEKARATGLLLRSAARHALYLAGGASDSALRQAAAKDAVACRKLGQGIEPGKSFSPAFRTFFKTAS